MLNVICAPPSPSGTQMTLSIQNGTTIAVTLVVNGKVIETVPAGGYEDPTKNELPGLPWDVETRSPSGRVLSSMTVHAGGVHGWQPALGGEHRSRDRRGPPRRGGDGARARGLVRNRRHR